jgi:hypothetical protein
MLNREELVALFKELRHEHVLSVYLDGNVHDFSERNTWRRRLENEGANLRKGLESTNSNELSDFKAAWKHIVAALEGFDGFLPEKGWAGFATANRLVHAGPVHVRLPDHVRWKEGMSAAPYVPALEQQRVVVTVLLDARRARVLEFRDGSVSETESFRADTFFGDMTDENASKRATTHTGVRGETSTDAAQKSLHASAAKLTKEIVDQLRTRVGKNGFIVLGGPDEAVAGLLKQLPRDLAARCTESSSMTFYMSDAEITRELEAAASELSARAQSAVLAEVENEAARGGRGALGRLAVEEALRDRRVDTLFVSHGFVTSSTDVADSFVGAAFEEGGNVEELSGDGAARLDALGEGVAARLRYVA